MEVSLLGPSVVVGFVFIVVSLVTKYVLILLILLAAVAAIVYFENTPKDKSTFGFCLRAYKVGPLF